MIAAIVAEYRKYFSTRMWWVMLLIAFGYLALISAGMAFLFDFALDQAEFGEIISSLFELAPVIYSMAASIGYLFPLLVGVVSVTTEYRNQTITPTFLAEPRRWVVLLAKLISSVSLGLVYGVVSVLGCVLAGGGTLKLLGYPMALGQSETWEMIGRSVLALVIWTIVGVGAGVLLKNQIAAIIVILAIVQFIEPMLQMIPAITGTSLKFLGYLPGAAGEAIVGGGMMTGMASSGGDNIILTMGGGISVLLAYGLICAVVGYFTTFRRDVS
ncbi:MAG: ABC transporter permease [Propionibacteriaceae bacterium]|jgi:hypothetical protein|nr:ABC transporter permease [Propionibacteriaceae bacterium]